MDGPSFVAMGFFREREPARTIPRGIFSGIIQFCDLPAFFSKNLSLRQQPVGWKKQGKENWYGGNKNR